MERGLLRLGIGTGKQGGKMIEWVVAVVIGVLFLLYDFYCERG